MRHGALPYWYDGSRVFGAFMVPSKPGYGGDAPQFAKGSAPADGRETEFETAVREARQELGLRPDAIVSQRESVEASVQGQQSTYVLRIRPIEVWGLESFMFPEYESREIWFIDLQDAPGQIRPEQAALLELVIATIPASSSSATPRMKNARLIREGEPPQKGESWAGARLEAELKDADPVMTSVAPARSIFDGLDATTRLLLGGSSGEELNGALDHAFGLISELAGIPDGLASGLRNPWTLDASHVAATAVARMLAGGLGEHEPGEGPPPRQWFDAMEEALAALERAGAVATAAGHGPRRFDPAFVCQYVLRALTDSVRHKFAIHDDVP